MCIAHSSLASQLSDDISHSVFCTDNSNKLRRDSSFPFDFRAVFTLQSTLSGCAWHLEHLAFLMISFEGFSEKQFIYFYDSTYATYTNKSTKCIQYLMSPEESSGRVDSYFICCLANGISVNHALCEMQPYIYIIPAVMLW